MHKTTSFLPLTSDSARRVGGDGSAAVQSWGGKGVSLLKLLAAGCPVPYGFAVPIHCCELYWQGGQRPPAAVQSELLQSLRELELASGITLGHGPDQLQLAVRSGAAVSMPGILCSVLNCASNDDVLAAVCRVWDSWQTPQAVAYRNAQGLEELAGTAVVVQVMVHTTVAGVLFTADPVRRACGLSLTGGDTTPEEMILEAIPGTGERLVSGEYAAWRWQIPSSGEPQCEHSLGDEPPLTAAQIEELAEWGERIATAFGGPVDIEWGLSPVGWHFFQARLIPPVLTPQQQGWLAAEQQRLARYRECGETLWVRHNLTDSVRFPTPLTWSVLQKFMSGAGGFGALYRRLGFAPSSRVRQQGFLELFFGQVYASPQRVPDLYCADWPFGYDLNSLAEHPELLEAAPSQLDLDRVGPWFLLKLPWLMWVMQRAQWRYRRALLTAADEFHHQTLPTWREYIATERQRNLSQLSEKELLDLFSAREQQVFQTWGPQLYWPGLIGLAASMDLKQTLQRVSSQDRAEQFCRELLLALPIWEDLPQVQDSLELTGVVSLPSAAEHAPQRRESVPLDAVWGELCSNFALGREQCSADQVLTAVWQLLPLRELCKAEFVQGVDLLRAVTQALAKSTDWGTDLYFLTREELAQPRSAKLIIEVSGRREQWQFFRTLPHFPVLGRNKAKGSESTEENVLRGTILSAGWAEGVAWRWRPESTESPPSGAILVCETLTPALSPWLPHVKGVVVDQASLLSHGALLVRQQGIPAVANPQATQIIQPGQRVQLDGNQGRIVLVSDHSETAGQ